MANKECNFSTLISDYIFLKPSKFVLEKNNKEGYIIIQDNKKEDSYGISPLTREVEEELKEILLCN